MSQSKKDTSQTHNPRQLDHGARSPAETGVILGAVPLEQFVLAQRAQMEALTKATNVLVEGLTAINREVVDFSDRRTRAMVDGTQAAPKNGDWTEVLNFQIDYAGHATQAYMEEATKLFELGVKVSQESWSPLQQSMATAFGGIFRKPD
jgi:hypothetical protein